MTSYRAAWQRVIALAGTVEDWSVPSPCTGWTAAHLAGHLADGADQIAALLAGGPTLPPITDPRELVRRAGAEPTHALRAAVAGLDAVLDDPPDVVDTPHGPLPLERVPGMALIEPVVHGRDLAQAAGRVIALDDDAVTGLLAGVEQLGDALAATGMYAPGRPAGGGAPPAERLLLALGRSPSRADTASSGWSGTGPEARPAGAA